MGRQSTKVCKYCSSEEGNVPIMSEKFDLGNIEMHAQVNLDDDYEMMWVGYYTVNGGEPLYQKSIDIKYCPMCGRKLG